jgi:hypothetical protein
LRAVGEEGRGLREILLPLRASRPGAGATTPLLRALFRPLETGERPVGLVDVLRQVTLFEDLDRRELRRLARIVHEREYRDGEYICEEGKPGVALFVIRRGVVEIMRRRQSGEEVPLVLLEPPASFEEMAATGAEVVRWTSARARGPVSLVVLGCSDLVALSRNFPLLANKILKKLAQIIATRFQMLAEGEYFKEDDKGVQP